MEYTNKNCELYGKNICSYVGAEGCETCFLNSGGDKRRGDMQDIYDSWQVTLAHIPENVDELHTSDKCQFCVGEQKNDQECYALLDLAHSEPEHKKGLFFGFGKKVRSEVGSMVTFPISACNACRARHRNRELIRIGAWVGLIAIAVLLLSIPAIGAAVASASEALSILIIIGAAIGGYYLGATAAEAYLKSASKKTAMEACEIPLVDDLMQRGWFALQSEGGVPRVSFVKKLARPHVMVKANVATENVVDKEDE